MVTVSKLDRKGIFSFFFIAFAITYAIEVGLALEGLRFVQFGAEIKPMGQYFILAVMWVPAFATLITVKFITREGFGLTNLRVGDLRAYFKVGLLFPAAFALVYALTWLLGLGHPDWTLEYFRNMFAAAGVPIPEMPSPLVIWPALLLASSIAGPFINGLFAFGEELGWRGYLLPKLLPLGKPRAYALLGIIWSLWHLPLLLVGFMYPGYPYIGILVFTLLTEALGLYLNELTLHEHSSVLAGWAHGAFNSQRFGVWGLLFPDANPVLAGFSGLIGIAVWLALGVWEARRGARVDARLAGQKAGLASQRKAIGT